MTAEWNVHAIAEMTRSENLRNTCRQLEQTYVAWRALAVHNGSCIAREWPAICELGRMTVAGQILSFETTRTRSIFIKDQKGAAREEVRMTIGMAERLFEIASTIASDYLMGAIRK